LERARLAVIGAILLVIIVVAGALMLGEGAGETPATTTAGVEESPATTTITTTTTATQATTKTTLIAATLKSGLSTFDVVEQDPALLEDLPIIIDVKRFTVPPNVVDAIAQGDAQLTVVPVELAAKIIVQTRGSVYIVALDNELNQAILARPDSGITSPIDLRGKKVAAVVGSGTYALFTVFMQELYGLTVGTDDADIIVINIGNPAGVLDALAAGDVDAAVIWEPLVSLGQYKYGFEIVATFKDLWAEYAGDKPAPMLVWVARQEVVDNPELLHAVLEAHKRAAIKWNENPEGWTVEMLARLYNLPEPVAQAVWERNQMYTEYCITGDLVDSMVTLWEMAVKAGYIDTIPDTTNIVTCEQANQP